MVRKILETLGASVRGLHQAAYLLALFTLGAQVLALIRDRIFAHAFGAGATLDLYYAAFRVPDIMFALIASLVSAYVLIPRISGHDVPHARKLLSNAASFLLIVGGLLSAVALVYMESILRTLYPSFVALPAFPDFVALAQLLLLQPILLGLSGVLTSVTQVHRRFMLFALSPILYNAGIIVGALLLYPVYGLFGIGMGVVLGALLHVVIHVPFVASVKMLPRLVLPSPKMMWSVMQDSVPRSLALSFGAVTMLVLTSVAATISEGSIAVFTLAGNLEAVPLALIGASYATAAFPVLSKNIQDNNHESFLRTLFAASRHVIFWSSIATIFVIVFRAHIVRVLLGTGAFDWDATRLTAALLAVLVVGLAAQGFVLLASRAFYAARRSWMPLFIQCMGLVVSVGGALLLLYISSAYPIVRYFFESLLRIEGVTGSDIVFIALGATLGQLMMGCLALATLSNVARGLARPLGKPLFEALGAALVGGASAYGLLALMGNIAPLSTLVSVFAQSLVAGIVGLTVTGAVLYALKNQELLELLASLKRWQSKALVPSGTVLNDRTHS